MYPTAGKNFPLCYKPKCFPSFLIPYENDEVNEIDSSLFFF